MTKTATMTPQQSSIEGKERSSTTLLIVMPSK
jgi:hypothetical protein